MTSLSAKQACRRGGMSACMVRALPSAWVLLACVLTGCATQPAKPALPATTGDPEAHQRAREAMLLSAQAWSLAGRIAVSNGRDGGSGRIDWTQDGDAYNVSLSAPVTRQSWRLTGAPGRVVLEGLEGGPREGRDASALLQEATRWDIPVEALSRWVRGMAADEARFGAVSYKFGEDGRMSRLEQGGWAVDYSDWRAGQAMSASAELPYRLNAVRGGARVRLIVDQWQ